jgi:hypothetical protein
MANPPGQDWFAENAPITSSGGDSGGDWFANNAPKASAPDTPTPEPAERPGFFKRLAQAFGVPDSNEGVAAVKAEADIRQHPENLIPLVSGAKVVGRMAGAVVDKVKQGAKEGLEAERNVKEGGPLLPNIAKASFAGLPDVAQGYGEDINNGNYWGAGGTATAAFLQAALTKLPSGLKNAKNALTVSPELERVAAGRTIPEYTPANAAIQKTAERSVGEIHEAALPELAQHAGAELDKVASQLGVDTSKATALSHKAELAGRGAKVAGQKLYAQLDQAAAETAGAEGGNFQRYAETIRNLERQSLDPSLTATQGEALTERLNNAKKEFDAFKKEMVKRGLSEQTIKQADKFWAQGSALDELSRHLLNTEDAAGNLKPTARPLDTQVKKLTAPASPRGHILKQATGDSADAISSAARRAQEQIVTEKAATAAAKRSLAADKEAATAAQKAAQAGADESAKTAQKRIETIKGRQKAIGKGALGALGLGVVAKYGGVKDVLSGR